MATCLSSRAARTTAALYETFPHTIVGWRWDSVCDCVYALLYRERSLRTYWNFDLIKRAVHGGDGDPHLGLDEPEEVEPEEEEEDDAGDGEHDHASERTLRQASAAVASSFF